MSALTPGAGGWTRGLGAEASPALLTSSPLGSFPLGVSLHKKPYRFPPKLLRTKVPRWATETRLKLSRELHALQHLSADMSPGWQGPSASSKTPVHADRGAWGPRSPQQCFECGTEITWFLKCFCV